MSVVVDSGMFNLIVGLVVWLVTIAIAWARIGGRIDMLTLRVSNIEEALKKIADVLTIQHANEKAQIATGEQIASLQKEVTMLHATVEGLRRGEGYITTRRASIEGEYSRAG